MKQIKQEVRQFVIDNFFFDDGDDQFADHDSFLETGIVDSMGILRLITFVEQTYAVSVQQEELVMDNWDSVERIARFVESKRQVVEAKN